MQRTSNPSIVGSNPTEGTKKNTHDKVVKKTTYIIRGKASEVERSKKMTIGDLVTLKKNVLTKLWESEEPPNLGAGIIIDNYEAAMTMTTYYKVQFSSVEAGWFEDFELTLLSEGLR